MDREQRADNATQDFKIKTFRFEFSESDPMLLRFNEMVINETRFVKSPGHWVFDSVSKWSN